MNENKRYDNNESCSSGFEGLIGLFVIMAMLVALFLLAMCPPVGALLVVILAKIRGW